jgi:16S rRNA (cytosine1402-N4)-methyltransferase
MSHTTAEHIPVLLQESLEYLAIRREGLYVDCTIGLGGHAEGILDRLGGSGRLIGLDRDPHALEIARRNLVGRHANFNLYHENFKNLPLVLTRLGISHIDGCLIDLGLSSLQVDSAERGFSFHKAGFLDMRMDPSQPTTAAQLVNELSEERLAEIFWRYGEERAARKIAAAIVEHRRNEKFRTTVQLAELVESVKGRRSDSSIHPATQVFQSLRVEVNQELTGLEEFLEEVTARLKKSGRLVAVSFHSLEERIVKRCFQKLSGRCVCFRPGDLCDCPRLSVVRVLTRRPVTPSEDEVRVNPRARSAKLRAVERL